MSEKKREDIPGDLAVLWRPARARNGGEKAKDFKGTFRRLTRYLKPHTGKLLIVLIAAILSTIFSIVSPKILGDATTILFKGFMAKMQGVPGPGSTLTLFGRSCSGLQAYIS